MSWHCPACIDRQGSESSTKKLAINLEKKVGHCWRCGFKFRSLATLFRYLNGGRLRAGEIELLRGVSAIPAASNLKSTVYGIIFGEHGEEQPLHPHDLPEATVWLSEYDRDDPVVSRAFEYLDSREVTDADILKFKLGYVPSGRFAGRVLFPVFQGGRLVYFTTRYCGVHASKSLNPRSREGYFSRDHCLLNYDSVLGEPIVNLVEGPFDTLAFDHAVCLFGKTISLPQISLLVSLVEDGLHELVISLDAEAATDALKLYHRLLTRVPKVTILSLDHGDPSERRADIQGFMAKRGRPTLEASVKARLLGQCMAWRFDHGDNSKKIEE
jgi:hypothetical protein